MFDFNHIFLFNLQRCRSCPAWCCLVRWSSPRAQSQEKDWESFPRLGSKQEQRWGLLPVESCLRSMWICWRITTSCGRWAHSLKSQGHLTVLCLVSSPAQSWPVVPVRCLTRMERCATSSMPARRTSAAGWPTSSAPGTNRNRTWRWSRLAAASFTKRWRWALFGFVQFADIITSCYVGLAFAAVVDFL